MQEPRNGQAASAMHMFPCPGCGATLVYPAGLDRMKCGHCDYEQDIAESEGTFLAAEYPLADFLAADRPSGWGCETFSFHCRSCGASLALAEKQTAGRCAFCDTSLVLERQAHADVIMPESLIPFQIEHQAAQRAFQNWLASLWLRPNDLRNRSCLRDIQGVYTPFWTFTARADSRWFAQSGRHYRASETRTDSDGRVRNVSVQRTAWTPAWGRHQAWHEDVLVCASRGLRESLVRDLEPFHTQSTLVPYRPEFLSGWLAEEYAVAPQEGWTKGKTRLEQAEYEACSSEVPGDTHAFLCVSTRLEEVTWKHVLLPVWMAVYHYQGRTYQVAVNGQTGKVSGEAPYSWVKVAMLVAAILALIWYFVQHNQTSCSIS